MRTSTLISYAPGDSDPVPLGTLGAVTDIEWIHGPQGPQALSCDLNYDPNADHRALQAGRWIYAMIAPGLPAWGGILREPARADPWRLEADGWYSLGKDYQAIPGASSPANYIDPTIDAAIARGLPWDKPPGNGYVGGFGPTAGGTDLDTYLAQVLALTGNEVIIGADRSFGVVNLAATLPPASYAVQVSIDPGGITSVDFANALFANYLGDGSQPGTVYGDRLNPTTYPAGIVSAIDQAGIDKVGRVERVADLTALGALTAVQAQAALTNVLGQVGTSPLFTASIEVDADAITTLAGGPVDPRTLSGLIVIRLRGGRPPLSVLINPLAPVEFRVGALTWIETTETVRMETYVQSLRNLDTALAPQPEPGAIVV